MKSKAVDLTQGSALRGIVFFALPILLSNIFQQLYNSIDTAVVGKFAGSVALAAVGSTAALINLLTGFFLGLATGTGVLYAMHYGAKDYEGLHRITDAAYLITLLCSVFITFVGVAFTEPMLRLMDTPDDVMHDAVVYLRIYFAGTVFNMLYNVASGMIRAGGDSSRPLIYLFISGVLNLILDISFVALFGMGVAGAAWATVIAQAVSAVLCLVHMMRDREELRFDVRRMRILKTAVWDVIRMSVPCGLQGSMFNISNFIVQMKYNAFGSIAMAGISAFNKIDGFVYMPTNAIGMAASTYVGQNLGAGRLGRLRGGVRLCLLLSFGCSLVMSTAVILSFNWTIRLFTDDLDAIAYARTMMYMLTTIEWTFIFTDILGGAIRGAGQAMPVTVITALCVCVFRLIWLPVVLHFIFDIRMVFLCYPITWILCSAVMTWYYFRRSTLRKTICAAPQE